MNDFRQIDIDFEVHKAIELARRSFSESPNHVLRRLLGIKKSSFTQNQSQPPNNQKSFKSWQGKGVELPHSTELRMDYNGVSYEGTIDNGKWLVEGTSYASPSGAANGVTVTKDGTKTQLNGWVYWQARLPGTEVWTPLSTLKSN